MSAAKHLHENLYTYRKYCEIDNDNNRYEIIDGVPYMMAAPSRQHQRILGRLFAILYNYLNDKPCEVFISPFDVRLAIYGEAEDDIVNVVQPDIVVYCDESKHNEKGGIAAPDIVIEILSPSSIKNDKYRKFNLYEKAGVKEYWIIDGANEAVEIFVLENGMFKRGAIWQTDDVFTSSVLEGLKIMASDIFPDHIHEAY